MVTPQQECRLNAKDVSFSALQATIANLEKNENVHLRGEHDGEIEGAITGSWVWNMASFNLAVRADVPSVVCQELERRFRESLVISPPDSLTSRVATLSDAQNLHAALDKIGDWFPTEAEEINRQRDAIVAEVSVNTEIAVKATSAAPRSLSGEETGEIAGEDSTAVDLSPCQVAILEAFFEAALFVWGILGIRRSVMARRKEAFFKNTKSYANSAMKRSINAMHEANGLAAKARAFASWMLGSAGAAGIWWGIREWYDGLSTTERWWQGAYVIATFAAWVASDSIAFVAEVLLSIAQAVKLVNSVEHVVEVCYP